MSSEVDRVYRLYNNAENAHDVDATRRLVDDALEVTINGILQLASGKADGQANSDLFEAYPDYSREVLEVVVSGDRGTVRWRMVGTPAVGTNRPPLDLHGCSIVTVREGRITQAHLYADTTILATILPGRSS